MRFSTDPKDPGYKAWLTGPPYVKEVYFNGRSMELNYVVTVDDVKGELVMQYVDHRTGQRMIVDGVIQCYTQKGEVRIVLDDEITYAVYRHGKTKDDCQAKFDNPIHFGGEPKIPTPFPLPVDFMGEPSRPGQFKTEKKRIR